MGLNSKKSRQSLLKVKFTWAHYSSCLWASFHAFTAGCSVAEGSGMGSPGHVEK